MVYLIYSFPDAKEENRIQQNIIFSPSQHQSLLLLKISLENGSSILFPEMRVRIYPSLGGTSRIKLLRAFIATEATDSSSEWVKRMPKTVFMAPSSWALSLFLSITEKNPRHSQIVLMPSR